MSYLNLEHKLLSVFREESLNKNLIVSVSGGLDSMALLSVLCELQKQLGLNLIVGHIHHGPSDDQEQEKYRQKSHDLVKKICESYKIQFISNYSTQPSKVLKSEAEFRQLREQNYESWLQTYADYNIVLGHHKNDVLENRLIQLIRGCGEKGFLSMGLKSKYKLRPMIGVSKTEIEAYASEKNVTFLNDPSNSSNKYLRNWLRNDWLPALNNYREGSVVTFAQSLNNIGESLVGQRGQIEQLWAKVYNASRQSFALDLLLLEPEAIQLNLLSKYLRLNNITNFSRNQLKEILKHLDSPQKKHSFKLLSHPWLVQDGEVRLQKK